MAYRLHDKKIKPEDMLPRFAVRNGATLHLNLDCFYWVPADTHDPAWHDHKNWPAPNYHPGNICQIPSPRTVDPRYPSAHTVRTSDDYQAIKLTNEGYNNIVLVFDDQTYNNNITVATSFGDTSEDQDNVIMLTITPNVAAFTDKPIELAFTLFISGTHTDGTVLQDAAFRGILVILPGRPMPSNSTSSGSESGGSNESGSGSSGGNGTGSWIISDD